jgi:hypothetical protein
LIVLVTYVFGCLFTQSVAIFLSTTPEAAPEIKETLLAYWGSVSLAMDTLYQASTSGDGWRFAAQPLWEISWYAYALFLIYIAFFLFVVVNTLTSLIIEATITNAAKESHQVIQDEYKKKAAYVNKFKELYANLDADHSGDISLSELSRYLTDPALLAFMESLEIDASDIEQFFAAVSGDGELSVDVETFVVGCMKLKGNARSMDLLSLCHAHRKLAFRHRVYESRVLAEFGVVRMAIDRMSEAIYHQSLTASLMPHPGTSLPSHHLTVEMPAPDLPNGKWSDGEEPAEVGAASTAPDVEQRPGHEYVHSLL